MRSSFDQDHQKQVQDAKTAADAFRHTIHSSRRSGGKGSESQAKKKKPDKDTKAVLAGKRVLDLKVARMLAPPAAYVYETTDGRKIRVFYGRRRVSTSSLISIGKALAIHHCLTWAWRTEENQPHGLKNPHDLSKIKLQ